MLIMGQSDEVQNGLPLCLYPLEAFLSSKATLLAHLSRRLIGELIVYKGICRPSVRPSVRRPSVNIFKRHLL